MDKFLLVKELLERDRSVRRFDASRGIGADMLKNLVGLTCLCASGRNLQPLRYRIVSSADECARLFPSLAWAGYYKDWAGPAEGERPTAYLVQCIDTELAADCLCDDGLHLQAITLGATALGLSGCIIKAFNKAKLVEAIGLPERYKPLYVLALGYAAEEVKLVGIGEDGDYKYYRDADDAQCVPKRSLSEILI